MNDSNHSGVRWLSSANVGWLLLGLAVCFNLLQLALSWDKPILGSYAFRQTQTAISTFWIAKGESWLAYPTPALGAPWSIPFEFPLYQWLVAGLADWIPGITLDQAGRLVSELFFLACLWPAWRIATNWRDGPSIFRVCATVVLLSPLYVFWSRSFMMESAVLFFSLWFVAALVDFMHRPDPYGFAEMTLTGSLAACIKITTYVGFAYAGAIIVCTAMIAIGWRSLGSRRVLSFMYPAVAVALSILALLLWLRFSDGLKQLNWYGKTFVAGAPGMLRWNFGTIAQRETMKIWHVALVRGPNEALGGWLVLLAAAIYIVFRSTWRQKSVFAALIFLYLSIFFTFTNLHIIHHYYQYANSIFMVCAVGYVIWCETNRNSRIAIALLLVVCAIEIGGFYRYFWRDMVEPNRQEQMLLATYIRNYVPKSEMLVTFGLDWSSEVPYYSEHRALMIPDGVGNDTLGLLARDIDAATDGTSVGAVIVCPNSFQGAHEDETGYHALLAATVEKKIAHTVGYCVVYS